MWHWPPSSMPDRSGKKHLAGDRTAPRSSSTPKTCTAAGLCYRPSTCLTGTAFDDERMGGTKAMRGRLIGLGIRRQVECHGGRSALDFRAECLREDEAEQTSQTYSKITEQASNPCQPQAQGYKGVQPSSPHRFRTPTTSMVESAAPHAGDTFCLVSRCASVRSGDLAHAARCSNISSRILLDKCC